MTPTLGTNGDYAVGTTYQKPLNTNGDVIGTYTYLGNGQWSVSDNIHGQWPTNVPTSSTGLAPTTIANTVDTPTQNTSVAQQPTSGSTGSGPDSVLIDNGRTYTTSGGVPSSGSIGGVDISNLPPELQQTLQGVQSYLTKLQANGQIVNPNLNLTPEKLAEFTAQAQSEINPYYATQLKLARENLLSNAGYSISQVQQNEQKLAKQYGLQYKAIGADAAERGFAQSGQRVTDETNLATDTQDTINANRRQLDFNIGNAERGFAQQYGGSNIPNLQIGNAPTATSGEPALTSGTGNRSLYTLDPAIYDGLVGSNEYQQKADVTNRVSQLTGAFNANQALTQARALTL